jgi:heme/copper-type cytochrome/quinol oxidase subunit 3
MSQPTSTADYRKYPKGPNFGLIVFLFCATIIIVAFAAYFVLRASGKKLLPGKYNPHPTSQALPAPSAIRAV